MRWLQLILVLCLLPLAACAANRTTLYDITPHGPYQLGGGDVIRVSVYGEDNLSKTYKVDDSGMISFPLVGPVHVAGLTAEQAASAIAAALADGFMRHPNVAAEVDTYRPFFIQ